MASLEQERARMAREHVSKIAEGSPADAKKYASIVHSMPALLRSAGLCQTIAFVASRSSEPQKVHLDHLAAQLGRVDSEIRSRADLERVVQSAEFESYVRLGREALRCADWYRRFVQSVLKIDASEAQDGDES